LQRLLLQRLCELQHQVLCVGDVEAPQLHVLCKRRAMIVCVCLSVCVCMCVCVYVCVCVYHAQVCAHVC
jgi:hypothetical protein